MEEKDNKIQKIMDYIVYIIFVGFFWWGMFTAVEQTVEIYWASSVIEFGLGLILIFYMVSRRMLTLYPR